MLTSSWSEGLTMQFTKCLKTL